MHIDENKRFDKRTIDREIREGSISQKEHKEYLAGLPDVSDKVYDPEEQTSRKEESIPSKRKRRA